MIKIIIVCIKSLSILANFVRVHKFANIIDTSNLAGNVAAICFVYMVRGNIIAEIVEGKVFVNMITTNTVVKFVDKKACVQGSKSLILNVFSLRIIKNCLRFLFM